MMGARTLSAYNTPRMDRAGKIMEKEKSGINC
jgi:hypothetical protein